MKEEYLEIEEYEGTNHSANNTEVGQEKEEINETVEIHFVPNSNEEQQQQQQREMSYDVYQTQPQDFDNGNDDQMLRKLLKKFQMSFLYPFFKAYDVTYRSLRFLSVDDINTTIRSVGHRAEFREKLFAWRRKRYRTNDAIIEYERTQLDNAASTNYNADSSPSISKAHKTDFSNTPTSQESHQIQSVKNTTEKCQNFMQSLKGESSTSCGMDNATSSMQFAASEMASDSEVNEMVETKKIKLENVIEFKENRLRSKLNIEELLEDSMFGPVMRAFYDKYGYLERKHRDELIRIIVNYVVSNDIKLHSSDFGKIVDMIIILFPSEDDSRDYYYINRQGKRNPMGRLYTKYYNTLKRMRVKDIHQEFTQDSATNVQSSTMAAESMPFGATTTQTISTTSNAKRRQSGSGSGSGGGKNVNEANSVCSNGSRSSVGAVGGDGNNTQIELIEDNVQEHIQLDDATACAIKNFLRCQGLEWSDVKTMWSKTYLSRQEDVEQLSVKEVLKQWPKYLSAKGIELFNIDFRFKFSRIKMNLLRRKWPHFARKMSIYYQTNIRDDVCKGLYALYKTNPGKDTEDYILTVLLNSVIIPMTRYRDSAGNRRKVSIVEAVDLFAIRVTSLDEMEQKREEFLMKYSEIQSDLVPLIVVVGDNNINISEIYVHFDIALYEMPDYLSALDACIQIYRVLNMPYPAANEYVWTFIQRYFYEIILPEDMKCPSMSSIVSYLKC